MVKSVVSDLESTQVTSINGFVLRDVKFLVDSKKTNFISYKSFIDHACRELLVRVKNEVRINGYLDCKVK